MLLNSVWSLSLARARAIFFHVAVSAVRACLACDVLVCMGLLCFVVLCDPRSRILPRPILGPRPQQGLRETTQKKIVLQTTTPTHELPHDYALTFVANVTKQIARI